MTQKFFHELDKEGMTRWGECFPPWIEAEFPRNLTSASKWLGFYLDPEIIGLIQI